MRQAHIRAGDYPLAPELVPPLALPLLTRILTVRPEQRASVPDMLEHEWVRAWEPRVLRAPLPRYGLTHTQASSCSSAWRHAMMGHASPSSSSMACPRPQPSSLPNLGSPTPSSSAASTSASACPLST